MGMCALLCGCSRGSTGYEAVSGSVTFEGKPLNEGTIQFFTTDEHPTAVAGANIAGGNYKVPGDHGLKPGKYLVRISSTERVEVPPVSPHAMSSFRVRERIPARYNTESTLNMEVSAGGSGSCNFKLEGGNP
jgi:hypothetical protein